MDSSIRTPLPAFDNILPRIYANLIFCFPIKPENEPRKVYEYLREGLSRTVESMPLLGGTVVSIQSDVQDTRKGRLEIVLPPHKDDCVVPLTFQDLTAVLDYDELMAEGLPDESLDGELLLSWGVMADTQIGSAVLMAQANFLRGGCFLSVGLHHSVGDGAAVVHMMQVWAQHCRQLQIGGDLEPVRAISQDLNRDLLRELWTANGNQHDASAYRHASREMWRFIGLKPVTDVPGSANGTGTPSTAPNTETGIFYVSGSAFAKLKEAGTKSSLSGVTANDALMALLWRGISKARFPADDPIHTRNETASLDTTVDGRAKFSSACPQDYFGNLVLMNTTFMSLASLTSPSTSLSFIAAEVRKTLDTISTERANAAFTLAASIPDYSNLSFPFATFEGTELCITSLVALPLFHLDFGGVFGDDGKPESVRPPKSDFASICRRCIVLPRRPSGGFEIVISLVEGEMQRLMADDEFTQYASFCC